MISIDYFQYVVCLVPHTRPHSLCFLFLECHRTIPKCPCGAERKFEFQLMPYLLDLLQKDVEQPNNDKDDKHPQIGDSNAMPGDERMSWGTIAVYSCCQSCDVSREEYVVVHKETFL